MEYKPRRVGHARASRKGVSCKICMADGSGQQLRDSQEVAVSPQYAAQPSTATFDWRKVVVGNAASQHSFGAGDGANRVQLMLCPSKAEGHIPPVSCASFLQQLPESAVGCGTRAAEEFQQTTSS